MAYKFDEASLKNGNGIIIEPSLKLEFLIETKKNDNKTYMQKYDHKLYCPECHKPQLGLVRSRHSSDYYLKGFPKQEHGDGCTYSFPPVTNNAFNKLLENPSSCDFVNSKLKALIDYLMKKTEQNTYSVLIKIEHDRISTNKVSTQDIKGKKNIKRLPTKSLTSPLSTDDYDVPKLFYGNVDIQFKRRNNKSSGSFFYSLDVFSRKTNSIICSITMSEGVFSHLKVPFAINIDTKYNDVLLAIATKLRKNGSYVNGNISYSDYCVIEVM